jgi:hypothetical protein
VTGLLVSEWIEQTGGAERVLDRLAGLFPDADMLCLWNDAPQRYPGRRVRETWLAGTPLRRHKALALPLMPATWRAPQRGYDWALVSSHAFATTSTWVRRACPSTSTCTRPPDTCGHPSSTRAATTSPPAWPVPRCARSTGEPRRRPPASRPNSRFVADRVERAWERPATVIHPPVDVAWIRSGGWREQLTDADRRVLDALPADFVLGVSRFIPYKRLDAVMQTGQLLGVPVVIAGHGPLEAELRAMAAEITVPVHFHIQPSDALVYALMERARIFVFPPIEDFGMVAVEAMASGTPVMANPRRRIRRVGAGGLGGALFDRSSPAEMRAAGRGVWVCTRGAIRRTRPAVRRDAVRRRAAHVGEPHIAFAKSRGLIRR